MPRKKARAERASTDAVSAYTHTAKRKNIPPAGLESEGRVAEAPKLRHDYNPHLPPALRSALGGARPPGALSASETDDLPELVQRAAAGKPLSADDLKSLAAALRRHEPWLEWSGKREKPWFEVEPVALHLHERVSTQAILRVLAREDVQRLLFADPQQDYAQAVQFYQHDVDWANRMILGDSLAVMASLARREDLTGKVQMIYLDPPYGIKFASNFQPQLGQRDVKDKAQDLTREPEMVRAYRDTWTLGIHSYLAYLRDRLAMAKELLADTGSIFVQISDENLHRVRCVMDEVFGAENFVTVIQFTKTSSASSDLLPSVCDYILWYARDIPRVKYRELFRTKVAGEEGASKYSFIELPTGERRLLEDDESHKLDTMPDGARCFTDDQLTSQRPPGSDAFPFREQKFSPLPGYWKTSIDGLNRLSQVDRIITAGNKVRFVRYLEDFPVFRLNNTWTDTGSVQSRTDPKIYVVQTATSVIQRCLLMTTDPGDLVLDPTCGSGTTAFVAEHWGRRWITCDTSRVALALARQRLMTARFTAYQLRELSAEDQQRNPHGHWIAEGSSGFLVGG